MITWRIYINGTEVEQPQGFSDLVLSIKRDDDWHGVFFEASTTDLTFYGNGAALLKAEKQANGLAATATFRAEAECGETVDILEATINFGTYIEKCGNDCVVQVSLEKTGCTMTLRNRYDQKVDMSKTTASDNITLLTDYPGLGLEIEMLAQSIFVGNEAEMSDIAISEVISDNVNWLDSDGFNNYRGFMTPPFPETTNQSLGVFNTSPIPDICGPLDSFTDVPPYPDFPTTTGTAELLGDLTCDLSETTTSFRIKGSGTVVLGGGVPAPSVVMMVTIFRLPAGLDGTIGLNWIKDYDVTIFSRNTTGTTAFDLEVLNMPVSLSQGDFIYFGIRTIGFSLGQITSFSVTFDPECYYKLLSIASCEPTDAEVSMVNETGSRLVESITDGCMRMKSDYYGRTDSEPYSSISDGCGSLRVLTNGLKLRNAETSNHFISLQEYFNGLRGIDNIGMGIETDEVLPSSEWVRVEPVEYFYQDVKILSLPSIPAASNKQEPDMGYSLIKIGYPNWQTERVNGLNEFNSTKEFKTSLSTINNTLDATSDFVAGGIPIEVTRQQTFANTGSADTKFDDNTFIICVTRNGEYSVTFSASGNSMTFDSTGDGSEFLVGFITIAGSVSNNGARTILSTSILTIPGQRVQIIIVFNGGATVDEVSNTVTFPGIISTGMFVEKGNIDNSANIFSPTTAYNWRIRPMYNLMRWFKSIAQTYVNLMNTTSKLFFSSGTGNYIAEGELPVGDGCKLENMVLAENNNLNTTQFSGDDYLPIYKPETIQFAYPLSIADYILIKANPYGYLEVQCGNGNFEKAFIKSIEYRPAEGMANFILIKKWI